MAMSVVTSKPVRLPGLIEQGKAQQRQEVVIAASLATVARGKSGVVDQGESNMVVPMQKPTRANDRAHDGAILGAQGVFSPVTPLELVEPLLPNNGVKPTQQVILINGIMTDVALQQADMQGLANTGASVVGIHNATQGMARDLLECVQNKLNRGDTPAIDTLARVIAQALQKDQPVRLVGHSQGALIVARSLQIVSKALEDAGLSQADVQKLLGRVTVETYGGASSSYVDGPAYKHYINKADVVPMLTGLGLDAFNPFGHVGQDAQLKSFVEARMPRNVPMKEGFEWGAARAVDQSVHGPRDIYFKHRK